MKTYVINNGKFTAENFSGYTAAGERVHIYGRQMASLNWESIEDVTFPFYALAAEKEITPKGSDEKVMRLTALSVFKTKQGIIDAKKEGILLDAEIEKSIQEEAEKIGISKATMETLLAAL